jgi:hypothetical protein
MKVRRKRIVAALLLCAALCLPEMTASSPGGGVTRCLVVGFDRFVTMPSTGHASENNTETMAALLEDFLPGEKQITIHVDGPGSIGSFEELIRGTFAGAREEDTALIYMSTHGVSAPEAPGGMALLISDGGQEEKLTPKKLREMLDGIPGKKILMADACRSGALIGRGTENGRDFFDDERYRALVSAGAEEDSWFWSAEEDEYTGTGYFTEALDSALRASDPEQIDPDGDGTVSLKELTGRLREIHGASTVYSRPEEDGEPLFILPEDRKAGGKLRGVQFDPVERDGDSLTLKFRFRAEEQVRLTYQLVPSRNGRWDFEHAVKMPDRERTGLIRGLVSPGEKERTIRLSPESLGEDGKALLQIISLRGEEQRPAAEAGRVIEIVPPGQENLEGE